MKVVVIGASGTIGKAVAAALAPRHEVIAASRKSGEQVDLADRACAELRLPISFEDDALELPGLGTRAVRALRVPGVGATHWLVSRASRIKR